MASIARIKASDGSGNAAVATVQNSRSPGSSTIVVDTVANINSTFMGSMGTPHTFVDPITAETITVIDEATAVDFSGHVDGANLEIDSIAPGYTDLGSAVDDIIIIRPTTDWADNVADVLDVAHDDDGSLKDDLVAAVNLVAQLQLGWSDAGETWVYVSGTGTITGVFKITGLDLTGKYQAGDRVKFTQSATVKYGIITKVSFSTDTTITLLMSATSGTVDNSGLANAAISANYYSRVKSPFGFPLSPTRWTISTTDTSDRTNTATTPTNTGSVSLALPIGAWNIRHSGTLEATRGATTFAEAFVTLSAANTTEDDKAMTAWVYISGASGTLTNRAPFHRQKTVLLSAAGTYYQNIWTSASSITAGVMGATNTTNLSAVCAYL